MNTASNPDFSQLAKPFIHYSRSYFDKIKSSLISKEDLKGLYKILAKKSDEAADLQLKLLPNLPDNVKEVFKNFKGKLWVEIWGRNNEYISGDHESIFNDDRLPNKIWRIRFNSYNGYQIAMQNNMQNWFELEFDFKKNRIFDFPRITAPTNQNNSNYKAQGNNETWVDGVYQAINSFLKDKARKRNWLYSDYTYDALLYLIFFPAILRCTYKFEPLLNASNLIIPLTVITTIYILVILLCTFRVLFNYAKWAFPIIELKNGNSVAHRSVLGAILLGLIIAAGYDIIKATAHLFF